MIALLDALGMALLHSVWQAALLAAGVAVIEPSLRSASARHTLAAGALFCLPLAFGISATAFLASSAYAPTPTLAGTAAPGVASTWATYLVPLWTLGVGVVSVLHLAGWQRIRSQRRASEPLEAEWQARLLRLADRMGIRRPITLLASRDADSPMVVGLLRPAILLPTATLARLSPEQLEAVLAHELAHVRRFDDWINAAQLVVETLFFFHPAVWWLSRRIRVEREHAADALAVRMGARPLALARALLTLEEARLVPRPALAANGGPLMDRIRRLVGSPSPPRRYRAIAVATGSAMIASALGLALLGTTAFADDPDEDDVDVDVEITDDGETRIIRIETAGELDEEALEALREVRSIVSVEVDGEPVVIQEDGGEVLVLPQGEWTVAPRANVIVELDGVEGLEALPALEGLEALRELHSLRALEVLDDLEDLKELKELEDLKDLEGIHTIEIIHVQDGRSGKRARRRLRKSELDGFEVIHLNDRQLRRIEREAELLQREAEVFERQAEAMEREAEAMERRAEETVEQHAEAMERHVEAMEKHVEAMDVHRIIEQQLRDQEAFRELPPEVRQQIREAIEEALEDLD